MKMFVAVAASWMIGLVSAFGAEEGKVALKDVPKAVLDAVKARFPGAELEGAEKEVKGGKTTYEVALKHKAKAVDVALTAEGKIIETETEVAAKDLPAAVASSLAAKYPKTAVRKAEEIVEFEGGKEIRSFEVLLTTEAKKSVEVKLSPEGKVLKLEDDAEDEKD